MVELQLQSGDGFSHSGSSPGGSNDSFVCSGGSPGIGSGFSFSGNSPTRSLVRPASRVVLTQQFHSENFRAVEVNRPSATCFGHSADFFTEGILCSHEK